MGARIPGPAFWVADLQVGVLAAICRLGSQAVINADLDVGVHKNVAIRQSPC